MLSAFSAWSPIAERPAKRQSERAMRRLSRRRDRRPPRRPLNVGLLRFQTSAMAESAELVTTLRRLVKEVIVHGEPGATGFSVEIKGRLSELTGAPAFPSRSKRGVLVVAREGLGSTTQKISTKTTK
jgi:hypothetical protein